MAGEKPTREGLIYDFYFDEAARLGQRTDWFLIFHAILLEAFFAAEKQFPARIVVGVLGFLTSYHDRVPTEVVITTSRRVYGSS